MECPSDVVPIPPLHPPLVSLNDVQDAKIFGESPDNELACNTKWIVFTSKDFKAAGFCEVTFTNEDPFSIAWCLKTRDRNMFRASECYGILKSGQNRKVNIYCMGSKEWLRDYNDILEARHQLCVENLRIPDHVQPESDVEAMKMAKDIYRRTAVVNPLVRMFWKMGVILNSSEKQALKVTVNSKELNNNSKENTTSSETEKKNKKSKEENKKEKKISKKSKDREKTKKRRK